MGARKEDIFLEQFSLHSTQPSTPERQLVSISVISEGLNFLWYENIEHTSGCPGSFNIGRSMHEKLGIGQIGNGRVIVFFTVIETVCCRYKEG